MRRQIIVLLCLVGLLGWFGVQAVHAQDHGKVMLDSGFKKWNVDTDKEKAFFKDHATGKIITYKKGNKTVHVFKHPETGHVYAGDDAAHQQYLVKVKAQNMTPMTQEDAAEANDPDFWQNWEDEYGP